MKYERIRPAVFLRRPNRFIAEIRTGGEETICHVKNTGRCGELLLPGAEIFVQESKAAGRKTNFDLISVYKGDNLINIDSQAPNQVVKENADFLFPQHQLLYPEKFYGASRFDFYIESGEVRMYAEVKGVTLEKEGTAYFPDAPTARGARHLRELALCRQEGYAAQILFIVQMQGVQTLRPNDGTDPAFGKALRDAEEAGVQIRAFGCRCTPDSLTLAEEIEVKL